MKLFLLRNFGFRSGNVFVAAALGIALLISGRGIKDSSAQDQAISRPFVTASIDRIRAYDASGTLTNSFVIKSVTENGEINDVARLSDGRFIAHASFYGANSRMVICSATSATSADCSEHPVRAPSFPFKFTMLGDAIYFSSKSTADEPESGIVRFDLTDFSTKLLPIGTGMVVAGQDGLLYLYQYETRSLAAFEPRSLEKIREVALPHEQNLSIGAIAVDAQGNIYVQNGLWQSQIIKLNPQGRVLTSIRFPNAIFSFRNSSDGYLLVNNLFKDPSRPSYPFRWETLLLNSDLEVQWRRSIGRSPVAAITEMECVRSPITMKVEKDGDAKVENGLLSQRFSVKVRNNDSTLCGGQTVNLSLPIAKHSTKIGNTAATLRPSESLETTLWVEASPTYVGEAHFELQAQGASSGAITKRDVRFQLHANISPDDANSHGSNSVARIQPPAPPRNLKVKIKNGRMKLSWKAASQRASGIKYLVYFNGEYRATVSATNFSMNSAKRTGARRSFTVRAIDTKAVMSSEISVRF